MYYQSLIYIYIEAKLVVKLFKSFWNKSQSLAIQKKEIENLMQQDLFKR